MSASRSSNSSPVPDSSASAEPETSEHAEQPAPDEPRGLALVADARGEIARVVHDTLTRGGSPPRSVMALVEASSLNACTLFVRGTADAGFSRSLAMRLGSEIVHAFGARVGDELWIVFVEKTSHVLPFCAAAAAAHPDDAPPLQLLADQIRAADSTHEMWDELARANNELVTTQRELARTVAELRRLNDYKNELLGIAAHDLRSPLNANLAFVNFLLEDSESMSEDSQMLIARLRTSTSFMLRLVEDVLSYAAIESGSVRLKLEEVAVEALVEEIVATIQVLAERRHIAIDYTPKPLPPAHVDRIKLSQAIHNLMANAVKFSPQGSRVTVTAEQSDGHLRIAIKDAGPGIPAAELPQLFKPFTQLSTATTTRERGTGLGLAITRRVVDAHGGKIEVSSREGGGSTFTIVVPLSARPGSSGKH